MVSANELRGAIAKQGYSQRKIAFMLGISEKTFYSKVKKGIFDSNEIEAMAKILEIDTPEEIIRIFFTDFVA